MLNPSRFRGEDVWVIGGGPSILTEFEVPEGLANRLRAGTADSQELGDCMAAIHGKNVISVNNAYQLGNWVDIAFFGERHWYRKHEDALKDHPAWKVHCDPLLENEPGLTYVPKDSYKKRGLAEQIDRVSWNLNSGAAAISLAYQLGAKRVILLGFDMDLDRQDELTSHWHGRHWEMGGRAVNDSDTEYARAKRSNFERHIRSFPAIAKDAARLGLTILNASPDSQIEDLPKTTVAEVLAQGTEAV